jgi:hypothetical protein
MNSKAAGDVLNANAFLPTTIAATHNSNCNPLIKTAIRVVTNEAKPGFSLFIKLMNPPG